MTIYGTSLKRLGEFFGSGGTAKVSGTFGFLATTISLAADVGTPWADLLSALCVALLILLTVLLVVCAYGKLISQKRGAPPRFCRISAVLAMHVVASLLIVGHFSACKRCLEAAPAYSLSM